MTKYPENLSRHSAMEVQKRRLRIDDVEFRDEYKDDIIHALKAIGSYGAWTILGLKKELLDRNGYDVCIYSIAKFIAKTSFIFDSIEPREGWRMVFINGKEYFWYIGDDVL